MRRNTGIVLAATSVAIFVSLFALTMPVTQAATIARESVSGIPFISLPSTETKPVLIEASGSKLVIPRNYLETAQIFRGRAVIGIVTTFPDFGGATPQTLAKFEPRNAVSSHETILVRRLTYVSSAFEQRNKIPIQAAIQHSGEDIGYGLLKVAVPHPAIIYVGLTSPSDQSVVIYCYRPGKIIRCDTEMDVIPGLVFSYEFDESLLPKWRELHSGVTKLLKTFVRGQ